MIGIVQIRTSVWGKVRIVKEYSKGRVSMKAKSIPTSLQLATTAINAALYAAIGALWTIFPITVFGVRFWPQVFVPGAFAVLFGPWTGGVGAAIGIFIGDVLYGHHDALLSLLVGVPSNFLGFFIIGWMTHSSQRGVAKRVLLFVSLLIPIALAAYGIVLVAGSAGIASPQVLVGLIGLIAVVTIVGLEVLRNKWIDFETAASIGLGVGSIWIGLGLVAYSSFFTLPAVLGLGGGALPVAFAYGTIAFTYLSEIPFLVLLTPPIVAASRAAFPSLRLAPQPAKTEPP
jgi:hypothetical protein